VSEQPPEEQRPTVWELAVRVHRRREQRNADRDDELARARAALARVVLVLRDQCFRGPDGRLAVHAADVLRAVAAPAEPKEDPR
jgi:hypothetical protein